MTSIGCEVENPLQEVWFQGKPWLKECNKRFFFIGETHIVKVKRTLFTGKKIENPHHFPKYLHISLAWKMYSKYANSGEINAIQYGKLM